MARQNFVNIGLHGLAPYIGKIRPSLAQSLIQEYCPRNGTVYDPFCGSGTIPLEAWREGREVIANDLNAYAVLVTKGKLYPPLNEKIVQRRLSRYNEILMKSDSKPKKSIPVWVRSFFHPKTLEEIIEWVDLLMSRREYFLLACLLGILHHQRPGFLSFPSSHGTPYLRTKKFPKSQYKELYKYRNVYKRLSSKVARVFKQFPSLDTKLSRKVYKTCASKCKPKADRIHTILTSPPYMKALTYARDNRLRLWFLGFDDYSYLDSRISPNKKAFVSLVNTSFKQWATFQQKNDKCIMIVGDMYLDTQKTQKLSDVIIQAAGAEGYRLISIVRDRIPIEKRVRKGVTSIKAEQVIVMKKLRG